MLTLKTKNGFVYLCGRLPKHVLSYIRTQVPESKRNYDSSLNAWGLEEGLFNSVKASILKEFEEIKTASVSPTLDDKYKTLHVTPDAPIEVVKAAYRALCLLNHPDLVGENTKMANINEAYESILKQNS